MSSDNVVALPETSVETPVPPPAAAPPPSRSRRPLVLGLIAALLLTIGGYEIVTSWGVEATDNAAVDGHVVTVASRVAGQVAEVRVREGTPVHKGDVLAVLDPADYEVRVAAAQADFDAASAARDAARAQVDALTGSTAAALTGASAGVGTARAGIDAADQAASQAEAALSAAKARATQAAADRQRAESLVGSGAMTKQQYDGAIAADDAAQAALLQAQAGLSAAKANASAARDRYGEAVARESQAKTGDSQVAVAVAQMEAAEARVAQAQAGLDAAKLQLSYTEVKAPFDGVVAKKSAEVGQMVQPGSGLFGFVGSDEVWVTANFKETQVEGMAPGDLVDVTVDGHSGKLQGTVVAVTPATGARFALIPPDNSSGNFTKVVQRVPVRVSLPPEAAGVVLPGESAEVTVHLR